MLVTMGDLQSSDIWPNIAPDDYTICYTGRTHITDGAYRDILRVTLSAHTVQMGPEGATHYKVTGCLSSADENGRVINDIITQSLLRVGLIDPQMSDADISEIMKLRESDALVLVPDTNALHNGTLHWLLTVLREVQVWILPIVVSLIQVQSRDSTLKQMWRNPSAKNLRQALRCRPLIN
jgi:hypothetical protein